MQEYLPIPERRYASPSAQRRSGEHWKARFGLATVVLLTLLSAGMLFRLAGVGVGLANSTLRGSASNAPPRPTAAATAPSAPAQQPAAQPAPQTQPAPASAPAAAAQPTALAAAQPTAPAPAPSPTTRPNQREYVVQQGDTLYSIAQRYNTTVDELVAANNLPSRNSILSIGQKLIIP